MSSAKSFRAFFATLALITLFSAPALSHTETKGNIQIIHPWAEPTTHHGSTRAFPTISNEGKSPLTLIGATTPVASEVRLMKKHSRIQRIQIAPEDTVAFDPDDAHLVLTGLTRPLKKGEMFQVTLNFTHGKSIDIHMMVGETAVMADMPMKNMRNIQQGALPKEPRN